MEEKKATPGESHFDASEHPRDDEGHFIPASHTTSKPHNPSLTERLIPTHLVIDHKVKNDDDLLDVHLGNPLRRITAILEDIKRQKAFSFTLKGSLGLAGVAIALGTFGIFGGSKVICNRRVQTQVGILRLLAYQNAADTSVLARMNEAWDALIGRNDRPPRVQQRYVLLQGDHTIHIKGANGTSEVGKKIIASGEYDSCSQTLTVATPVSIEKY